MKKTLLLLLIILPSLLFSNETVAIDILDNEVIASYYIPEGQYMVVQENFFYIKLKENAFYDFKFYGYPDEDKISGTAILKGKLIPKAGIKPGEYVLEFDTGYQYCDITGACFFPQKETISASIIYDKKNLSFIKFIIFAFLGGLLLNIMPCVLPVLSIKALSLVKQAKEDRKSLIKHGFLYSSGILTTLIILALVIIGIKLSGEAVGWGFQFQNPKFTIFLLSIVFLFGLSLFELFFVSLPGNFSGKFIGKNRFSGSFFSGVFAVILATPCSAPFLGTALGFAFSQHPYIIILIFISIGLGLSMPFIILGFFPGFIKLIPKPGNWMNTFRVIMGFLLMGTSVWLLDVLNRQLNNMTPVYIFLLLLAISAWIYGKFASSSSGKRSSIIASIIVLALIIGGSINISKSLSSSPEKMDYVKDSFSEDYLNQLLAANERVFVQFSAAWCMTCRVNENSVLNTDEIKTLFRNNNVHILKGDFTNKNPKILEFMEKHNRAAVPFYAYFQNDRVVILPEIITKKNIYDLFN